MHATLEGLGLGDGGVSKGSVLAATLILLLKEGASHAASLTFAFFTAARLDSEIRAWRLFADVANDFGLALELAAPRLSGGRRNVFIIVSAVANACKAVCGVAAGATRVAVSAHFARASARGNQGGGGAAAVAEVAAKEGTQETAVTLLGLVLGALLAKALNASHAAQWTAFSLLTLLHVLANAAAVRSLALETVSRTRAKALYDAYANKKNLPSPDAARVGERLWPVQWAGGGERSDGGGLRLGVPLNAFAEAMKGRDWTRAVVLVRPSKGQKVTSLNPSKKLLAKKGVSLLSQVLMEADGGEDSDFFLLLLLKQGDTALVAFGADASPRTMLAGWAAGACSMDSCDTAIFLKEAEEAGWDLDTTALEEEGFRLRLEGGGKKMK